MSLSCECGDDYDRYYAPAADFAPLQLSRAKRCCSCRSLIRVGEDALAFRCWRRPGYDTIEEKIYGEDGEVPMAPRFMCERCGGLFMALEDLNFCISLDDNMVSLAKEYGQMQREAGVFRGAMVMPTIQEGR